MRNDTLYVSDLDGTLLNGQSQLSEGTISSLNRLIQEEGALFTVATARTPATVTGIMEKVNTRLPFIVMAGAAYWDNAREQYQKTRFIPNDLVTRLLECYGHHDIHPFIYRQHGNCIHAHHVAAMTDAEREFINHRLTSPLKQLFVQEKLSGQDEDGTMLVFSMGTYTALRAIADEIEQQSLPCTFMCYHDIFDHEQGYLEIYAAGTTKAQAIQHMASQLGVERTVVFGDNLNDIPMMQEASHSVAVGNAFEEVKNQADEIIGTNEEDAVVHWIERDVKTPVAR